MQLELTSDDRRRAISPFRELGAYETIWQDQKASFKSIAEKFASRPGAVPSDFVPAGKAERAAECVYEKLHDAAVDGFGVRVHGAAEYPAKLRDARHPVELLYYCGWWNLVNSRSVAVVGTREPTLEGQARTRKLVKALVEDGFTIVSGLAKGIDTIAHKTALELGGRTIAVIGTPLSHSYPKENADLQREIAAHYLVISQVPVLRYEQQDYRINRLFFPERNKTMSALTEATIIVEAGETSGTLIQARAALEQGRKLFILDSCFQDPKLTWPEKYAKKGAIRVRDYDDIRNALSK
jgi:DNA processing protein